MSQPRPPYFRCASCAHVIMNGRCRCSHPKDEEWRLLIRRPIGVFTMRNDMTEGLIFLACLLLGGGIGIGLFIAWMI